MRQISQWIYRNTTFLFSLLLYSSPPPTSCSVLLVTSSLHSCYCRSLTLCGPVNSLLVIVFIEFADASCPSCKRPLQGPGTTYYKNNNIIITIRKCTHNLVLSVEWQILLKRDSRGFFVGISLLTSTSADGFANILHIRLKCWPRHNTCILCFGWTF